MFFFTSKVMSNISKLEAKEDETDDDEGQQLDPDDDDESEHDGESHGHDGKGETEHDENDVKDESEDKTKKDVEKNESDKQKHDDEPKANVGGKEKHDEKKHDHYKSKHNDRTNHHAMKQHHTAHLAQVQKLEQDIVDLLEEEKFHEATIRMNSTIDEAFTEIYKDVVNALSRVVKLNHVLLNGTQPGTWCVNKLHEAAKQFLEHAIKAAKFNTAFYKKISYETEHKADNRADLIHIASRNVREEICLVDTQLRKFKDEAVGNIDSMGHLGFGLQKPKQEHAKYKEYVEECTKAYKSYNLPHADGTAKKVEHTSSTNAAHHFSPQQLARLYTPPVIAPYRSVVYKRHGRRKGMLN